MSSQRPQPVLLDMPKHILEKIIEGTGDFKESFFLVEEDYANLSLLAKSNLPPEN
ncbi:hypothetical protein CAEBREN_26228 [Caenorhabditis brenneri]|uniref:Uncharacterized protein n=1 Tax=Caenorhabditis brenneri TaxID=135651 RepID=G0MVZ5_CAEBE|nr:hypothetical protein CAEBREN_26228 [Caenorhabditis brenneri]